MSTRCTHDKVTHSSTTYCLGITDCTMEELSPLQTQLLLKRGRKRIYSSEEEQDSRPSEVQDIHCDSSTPVCTDGGSYPLTPEHETLIKFTHLEEIAWDSDVASDTSTPTYKRGKHQVQDENTQTQACSKQDQEDHLDWLAHMEIIEHRLKLEPPAWIRKRGNKGHSLLILSDALLANWPQNDKICSLCE